MNQRPPIFFVDTLPLADRESSLPEGVVHHLRVRRELVLGFELLLSTGKFFTCARIISLGKKTVQICTGSIQDVPAHQSNIHLYQAVLKPESMAWLCQKATEMGISSITPFFAERSQHHYWTAKSAQHIMKIIESAAAQSYQLQLPQLGSVCRLEELSWPNTYQWITADFDGSQWPHGCSSQPLGLLIGPEGGWTSKDKNLLPKEMHVVRLTPTVLRAETAALMCLSLAFLR